MTIVYTIPDFNLLGDWWVFPNTPSAGAATLTGIPVQKYVFSRVPPWTQPQIRFAPNALPTMNNGDIWEVPAGSGRYWKAAAWGIFHEGFPNEYWMEECIYVDATGNPKSNFP